MAEPTPRFKSCPHCGARLHPDASFCPHCAQSVNSRTEMLPPAIGWRRALRRALPLLAVLLLVGCGAAWYFAARPQVYDGMGEVTYTGQGRTYRLMLSDTNHPYEPGPTAQHNAIVKNAYRTPTLLYITDADSGEDAGPEFLDKVKRVTAEYPTPSGGGITVSCTAPASHDAFPGVPLVSLTDYTAEADFTTQMVWTFNMNNGDTIRLRQNLEINAIRTYDYHPADAPMGTIEELQALVDRLSAALDEDSVVNLYLPAVTYEGELAIRSLSISLYGSAEGDRRTTFTGSVRYEAGADRQISYVQDIIFRGSGTETALSASARVRAINCTFTSWDTAFLGTAWINAESSTFENNRVGLHFNCLHGTPSHSMYNDNVFRNNGTAVLLENVPGGDLSLDFQNTVFSGNGIDIDNRCQQPVDLSQAIFENGK